MANGLRFVGAALIALSTLAASSPASALPNSWGLIAPNAVPMKAVYFFPGNPPSGDYPWNFTRFPYNPVYLAWQTAANQDVILSDIASTGANVIVMSTWFLSSTESAQGPMWPNWPDSYDALFDAALRMPSAGRPQILPAIEGHRTDRICPGDLCPASDYPWPRGATGFSPASTWLLTYVETLVNRYIVAPKNPAWPSEWVQMFDSSGHPRYVINLVHLASRFDSSAADYAQGLENLASWVKTDTKVDVGFTIDPYTLPPDASTTAYTPSPKNPPPLASQAAFLGIQAFNPEITDGECDPQLSPNSGSTKDAYFGICNYSRIADNACNGTCTDNNTYSSNGTTWNVDNIVAWKRDWIQSWVEDNVPVFLDVSPGYDAHLFFPSNTVGLYGDEAWGGDNDHFRNGESELKHVYPNGGTVQGIVYNAWNGFVEGLVGTANCTESAVSTPTTECGASAMRATQKSWLQMQFAVDPRICDHWEWGPVPTAPTYHSALFHVYGSICDHWQGLGGSAAFGSPTTSEEDTPGHATTGGRKNEFVNGGTIYWGSSTGVHEVHGSIGHAYHVYNGTLSSEDAGCLGLPTSDQTTAAAPYPSGSQENYFQHGAIVWEAGQSCSWVECSGTWKGCF